jgi:hypothetical protein
MMQDGIVARYLKDHCPEQRLKLCPYRNELPATADDFLWGHSMFDTLGRFRGLDDEMSFIVRRSLVEHPLWQGRGRSRRHGTATRRRGHRRRHQWLDSPYLRHH